MLNFLNLLQCFLHVSFAAEQFVDKTTAYLVEGRRSNTGHFGEDFESLLVISCSIVVELYVLLLNLELQLLINVLILNEIQEVDSTLIIFFVGEVKSGVKEDSS